MKTIGVTFALAFILGGCSNNLSSNSVIQERCIQGWYLSQPKFSSCFCADASSGQECAFIDCQRWMYSGFQGNLYYAGQISYSLSGRVMSGTAGTLPFQMTDGGYRIDQTDFTGMVTACSQDSMQVNGITLIRPPDEVAAGLSMISTEHQTSWKSLQLP